MYNTQYAVKTLLIVRLVISVRHEFEPLSGFYHFLEQDTQASLLSNQV